MGSTAPVRLSVVIPALNEQQELPETLRRAQAVPEVTEIIVSDGGSTDETIAIARAVGAQVVTGRSGRGAQLRLGAEYATGEVVILLHADTWLPRDAGKAILEVLGFNRTTSGGREGNRNIVGGGFRKTFRDAPWWLHSTASWRSMAYFRLTGRLLGDQAIFVRRTDLTALGGVPPLPLMEEFALCHQLRKRGRLVLAPTHVSTSARRFRERGVLRTWWLMLHLQVAWACGRTPEELARTYHHRP